MEIDLPLLIKLIEDEQLRNELKAYFPYEEGMLAKFLARANGAQVAISRKVV